MKRFFYLSFIFVILFLSACGGSATPTMSAEDAQNTAVAEALANVWVGMTQTQAAMPTETPTPLPTPMPTIAVPQLFPTLAPAVPAAPVGSPTLDPCNDVPPIKPVGKVVQVRFLNKSKGVVTWLSFGMNAPNGQGECGTYGFTLGRYDEVLATVLAGCYWAYAYIDTPSNAQNIAPLCVNDSTKAVPIWIGDEVINFH